MKHVLWACALGLSASFVAWAGDTKVSVQAEVVLASTQGSTIDPPSLAPMKDKLAKKAAYTSLKMLSSQKLTLPAELKLPNNQTALVALEELKDGVAKVRVTVSPLSTVYSLGREGSLFQSAGKYDNGDLWLVLSASK